MVTIGLSSVFKFLVDKEILFICFLVKIDTESLFIIIIIIIVILNGETFRRFKDVIKKKKFWMQEVDHSNTVWLALLSNVYYWLGIIYAILQVTTNKVIISLLSFALVAL